MTSATEVPVYSRPRVRRRLHQLVIVLSTLAMLGCVAMVGGPFINDRKIESDPGRALATVTEVGVLRTTVDYQDEDGIYHSPPTGLLYPTGLGEGQRVWVTYSRENPELVKVENREWTLSIIPASSVAVVVAMVTALAWWLVNFLTRPKRESVEPDRDG